MSDQQEPATGLTAGLKGFAEGLIITLIGFGVVMLLRHGFLIQQEWPRIVLTALAIGVVFGIGRGITGRLSGAMLGGIAGVFLGGWVSSFLPAWEINHVTEEPTPAVVGELFALQGPTLDGKTLDIADYKGKVVLVDFWATWCGPCVHEMPNVVSAYEKYHADGFEVVGVSLDDSQEKLEAFVKENKIAWPQVFFTEKGKRGWQNPLAREHQVEGIPATFLLDREGRVVATDLRGDQLEASLAGLLGKGKVAAGKGDKPGVRMKITIIPVGMYLAMALGAVVLGTVGAFIQRGMSKPTTPVAS